MNENRTLHDWANELPAEYRQDLKARCLDTVQHIRSVPGLIQYVINALSGFPSALVSPPARLEEPKGKQAWEILLEVYESGRTKDFHVAYMTEPYLSTGLTVVAVDMFHAIDIVLARTGKSLDQIVYVHSKDSAYKEK